ncbi:hypothetical protein [Ruminococcus sp.]|uniref:hypothetical protein n=1 Tax=Ruminococcus sp. TaxID=41978 RepID=UPI0026000063|nr:hypothetical protein [Ruminococcus sp.]
MNYNKFYRELLKVVMKDLEQPKEHRKPTAMYSLSGDGKRIMLTYNGIFGLITDQDKVPIDMGRLGHSITLYKNNAAWESGAEAIHLTDKRIARGNDLIAVFDDDSRVNAKFLSFFPDDATFARNGCTVFVYDGGEWCGVIMCVTCV